MKSRILLITAVLLTFSACSSKRIDVDDKDILEVKTYNTVMKKGKVLIDPVHGKETFMTYGAVLGVNKTNANGVAFLHHFEDGVSIITINLNILPAKEGAYFEAALVNPESSEAKDGGKLTSIIGDARHSAKFETKDAVEGFTEVQVFQVAGTQRELIATGALKRAP